MGAGGYLLSWSQRTVTNLTDRAGLVSTGCGGALQHCPCSKWARSVEMLCQQFCYQGFTTDLGRDVFASEISQEVKF